MHSCQTEYVRMAAGNNRTVSQGAINQRRCSLEPLVTEIVACGSYSECNRIAGAAHSALRLVCDHRRGGHGKRCRGGGPPLSPCFCSRVGVNSPRLLPFFFKHSPPPPPAPLSPRLSLTGST